MPKEKSVRELKRGGEPSVAEAAAEVVGSLTRLGLTLVTLPATWLPADVRDDVLDVTRGAVQATALFPRAIAHALEEFANDIEELERKAARREDLGTRRRRARRRKYEEFEEDED
ncbi:MAG: hypothetical protein Q9O62_06385 [Ardenticatenia bacterium]|nr:hypothetical protein [Ardenticatenia bacterium]